MVPIGRNAAERDDGCGQWQWSQRNRRKHEQQPAETGPRGPVRFRWWRNVLRRMGGWQSTRTRRLHRSQRPGRILRFLELRFRSFRCLHLARVKRKKSLSFLDVWYRSDYTSELKTVVYKHTCCLLHPHINAFFSFLKSESMINFLLQSPMALWMKSLSPISFRRVSCVSCSQ